MGMQISAKLIYGCYYSELPEEILEEVNEMLDSGDLDYASPTYDAPRDEWVVGIRISCNGVSLHELHINAIEASNELFDLISYREGLNAGVYVSPDVT